MTAFGVVLNAPPLPPSPSGPIFAASFVTVDSHQQDEFPNRVVLPVFDADISAGDAKSLSCPEKLERLATEEKSAVDGIREIACGLRSCAVPDHEVTIDIQGFASSRDFACDRGQSNEWNLKLAERRRVRIAALIMGSLKGVHHCDAAGLSLEKEHPIRIVPKIEDPRWTGSAEEQMQQMETARAVIDRSARGPDRGREILARRADLVVVNSGLCTDAHIPADDATK
jgi:hypothetical protein